MKLQRFFINRPLPEEEEEITVSDNSLFHQWRDVFRYNIGSLVVLFDQSGFEALCQITLFGVFEVKLLVLEKRKSRIVPKRELHLFQALIKKDNFEWVLAKGTELGISHFYPILADRSEKKGLNFERARVIVKESAEQSGRGMIPSVTPILTLADGLLAVTCPLIFFHPAGKKFLSTHCPEAGGKSLGVFIGPEGGWSDRELKIFAKKDVPRYSLGPATLRAETAAIAVSALLLLS